MHVKLYNIKKNTNLLINILFFNRSIWIYMIFFFRKTIMNTMYSISICSSIFCNIVIIKIMKLLEIVEIERFNLFSFLFFLKVFRQSTIIYVHQV